jgi:hypothetical protein
MRVYLPATTTRLHELLDAGELTVLPLLGYAVTPEFRAWYVDADVESLEYAAMVEAARASLRMLDADPAAARRRVVIAADIDDDLVALRDDLDRGVVELRAPVSMTQIASVHVDDDEAEAVVAKAAASMMAAELGDDQSQDDVDDAEGFELSWYATQEIAGLLAIG